MHESLIRLKFPLMTNEFALVLVQELSLFIIGQHADFRNRRSNSLWASLSFVSVEYVSFVVDIASPALSVACVARFVSFVALSDPDCGSVCSSPLVDNHLNSSHPSVQCPTFVFPFVRHLCSLAQLLSSTWLITCTAPVTLRPVT